MTCQKLRNILGVSQAVMAKIFGVSQATWSRYETGELDTSPQIKQAMMIFSELPLEVKKHIVEESTKK